MEKMNKHKAVLQHLQSKGSITSLEAFELYGATRLSAIIFNLRRKGYDIITEDVTGKDRYGSSMTYAKYRLIQ